MRGIPVVLLGSMLSVGCVLQPSDAVEDSAYNAPAGPSPMTGAQVSGALPPPEGLRRVRVTVATSGNSHEGSGAGAGGTAKQGSTGSSPCQGPDCEPDPQPWEPPSQPGGKP